MKPRITRVPPITGASSWSAAVDALARAINIALSDVADAFEGKGALARASLEDIFDAGSGFPRFLSHPLRSRPHGLTVIAAENLTDGGVFTDAVFPTWDLAVDGRIAVRGLTGLTTGKRYRIRYEVSV